MLLRLLTALLLIIASPSWAAPVSVRISTENTSSHVQTRMIERFVERLNKRGAGRIQAQLHHSAALFRDRDVVAAMAAGYVDMAAPGMWQLDRFAPDLSAFMLPQFWGRDADIHHRVRDGAAGRFAANRLEDAIGVHVLGRWIDLGHAHLYFTQTGITDLDQVAGKRIRIAGGRANAAIIRHLDADPMVIAWPDLPDALNHRTVDGVLTTHETVLSAALWNNGIRRSLETKSYFAQYIPIVSQSFWDSLSEPLRRLMTDTWESVVDEARNEAAASQAEARRRLIAAGISIANPSAPPPAARRKMDDDLGARLAAELNVSAEMLRLTAEALQ